MCFTDFQSRGAKGIMITIRTHLIIDKFETGLHISDLLKFNKAAPAEFQQYLGFSSVQSIYHWLNGSCLPSIDNLVLLSHLSSIPKK